MKQIFFTVLVAAAMTTSAAESGGQYFKTIGTGNPAGMSPNGRYAVGTDSSNEFKSFLWDGATGETVWMTDFDLNEDPETYEESGMFNYVNDSGVIVGACKDKEMMMVWDDGWDRFVQPLMTASIWKDGELTKLGVGDFKMEDFLDLADGSVAVAVDGEGKRVVGYVMRGNTAYYTPVGWDYNEATGEWDFSRYALPAEAANGEIGSISRDGSVSVGYAKIGMKAMPVYWTSPDTCVQIQLTPEDAAVYDDDFNWNYAYAVSPNGKYILFTLNNIIPCVYSVEEKTYRKVFVNADAGNLRVRSIADNGDTAGTFVYGNFFTGTRNAAFWYSYANDVFTPFDYFIGLYASEIQDLPSFDPALIRSMSADGSVYFGSTGNNLWVLKADSERITIPKALTFVTASNDNVGELAITWKPSETVPEGYVLKGYNVYLNGGQIATIESGSGFYYLASGLEPATYGVEIEQEFMTGDGKVIKSPKSEKITVSVSPDFSIPLFDDFESQSFNTNSWTVELLQGNLFHDLKWHHRMISDGYNNTLNLTAIIDTWEPYESVISTRYIDATELKEVYVSFSKKMMYANRDDWNLDNDYLSLEISYDGKNWNTVKDYCTKDVVAGKWLYEKIDLSGIASGKKFKLRLNAHGNADAHVVWYLDTFKVGSGDEVAAPAGLVADVVDGDVSLKWKNSIDAYELSYCENSPILYEFTIGDEGNPFIVANSFDENQLSLYAGKFITSVTTFLYDSPWLDAAEPTRASIVIFADNELVYEQEIEEIVQGWTFTVKLDKGVAIEAGKEYKIGMKIYDYHPEQMPIYYQVTELFQQWKSDLFSQDGGKTWQSLMEFYSDKEGSEEWGYCVWPIRANITEEEVVYGDCELDSNLEGYNVYRNGELINSKLVYPAYLKYLDENPLSDATYEVVAFYTNGDSSEKSAPCRVNVSGVDKVNADPVESYVHVAGKIVLPEGTEKACLYDMSGRQASVSYGEVLSLKGVQPGLYILSVEKDGKEMSHRVMIR